MRDPASHAGAVRGSGRSHQRRQQRRSLRTCSAINCLQNLSRTRTGHVGVVQVAANDAHLTRIELANAGMSVEGTVLSANLYINAIMVAGRNATSLIAWAKSPDGGFYVSGAQNRFSTCRADYNYGHGWTIVGGSNSFAACQSVANGKATSKHVQRVPHDRGWQCLCRVY